MDSNIKEGNKPSACQFLGATLLVSLMYLFIWYVVRDGDLPTAYVWYIHAVICLGVVATIVTAVTMVLRERFFPKVFEEPSERPGWYGAALVSIVAVVSVGGGMIDGWETGLLLLWPTGFWATFVVDAYAWAQHQVKVHLGKQ